MNQKFFLLAALAGFAICAPCAASAQNEETPPRTDSGVLVSPPQRMSVDEFLGLRGCPDDLPPGEICVEATPDEPEPEPAPPDPGDRLLDVQAERETLSEMGSTTTPTDCSAVGAAGQFGGCTQQVFRDWKKERELKKAQEDVPDPY